jgi:glutathione S-transferase
MLELYNFPMSTCSQKVRLVLAEKGLAWKDRRIDSARREQLSPEYLQLNPNGVVPTLIHDGDPIIDSSVINEYLDEVFPEVPLRPADPKERARMRAWRQYIDEVPTVAIRPPSFNFFLVQNYAGMTDEQFAALTERMPLRKHFYRRMGRGGFGKEDIDEAIEKLEATLRRMETALAEGPWLNGRDYTLADVSITPTIVRMEDLGLAHHWNDKKHVAGWYERTQARPAFAATYYPGARVVGPTC